MRGLLEFCRRGRKEEKGHRCALRQWAQRRAAEVIGDDGVAEMKRNIDCAAVEYIRIDHIVRPKIKKITVCFSVWKGVVPYSMLANDCGKLS